jgi:drug/metabolite transporter (DMT)-like permease
MTDRVRLIGLGSALLSVVFWGGSFVATKVALLDVSPATIVWLRFGLGLIVMGLLSLGTYRRAGFSRRDLLLFLLLGVIGITLHQLLQVTGLQTVRATTTAWVISTTPIFIALLGVLFLHERVRWNTVIGMAVGSIGVILVVGRGNLPWLGDGTAVRTGDLFVLLSAITWAVFSVLSRPLLQRHDPYLMMMIVMLFGWLCTTPSFLWSGGMNEIERLRPEGWIALAYLGLCCSGLAFAFWYRALKVLPATEVGAVMYLEPLVTLAVARLVLGEDSPPVVLAGGILIVAGVWLVTRTPGHKSLRSMRPVQK